MTTAKKGGSKEARHTPEKADDKYHGYYDNSDWKYIHYV